jgi:multidrug efflux pump subunit AcrB
VLALAGTIVRAPSFGIPSSWWTSWSLRGRRGPDWRDAVVEAGVVRARPILLTAAAVVIGRAVKVRDPIFQGLGIAMMSGAVVATLLTLVAIPLLYANLAGRGPAGATR